MFNERIILWDTKYGTIHINLKNLLATKKLTLYQLCRLTGCKYDVIKRYYDDKLMRVDMDILAKICYVLSCDISELIRYY